LLSLFFVVQLKENNKRLIVMESSISHFPRHNEYGNIPFRTDRFFCVGNKWYFSTREGFDSGPYANKERAKNSLERFINIASKLPASETLH
tara:strand:+ start:5043 stop:5315 length:273 start_codon:yes stop_codon:yes gene_type:complete